MKFITMVKRKGKKKRNNEIPNIFNEMDH